MPLSRLAFFLATAGAMLVSAGTVLGRFESRLWVLAGLVAYCALCVAGLARPSMRMFTDAVIRAPEGCAVLIDLALHRADPDAPLSALLRLFDARGAKVMFAVTLDDAARSPAVIREILARGHGLVLRDPTVERGRGLSRRGHWVSALDAGHEAFEAALPEVAVPELWASDRWHTPGLQRIADAYEHTLVAPTVDLRRACRAPAGAGEDVEGDAENPLENPSQNTADGPSGPPSHGRSAAARASLEEVLRGAVEDGAIVRLADTPTLRAAIGALLDAAGGLGVPVRPLFVPMGA
jgi:hypothetical protein